MTSHEAQLLEVSLQHIRGDLKRMAETMLIVNARLEALPLIQQAQQAQQADLARGAARMDSQDERLQEIERELPGLKELRRWVIGGMGLSVTMMGAALIKMVLVAH
jgi:hypothetical protein